MDDTHFMALALKEAHKGAKSDNYPVGAVIVAEGKVIARSSNSVQQDDDRTAHAELKAIRKAASKIKNCVNKDIRVTIYTTLEPCLMCFGAIVLNRISRIVYACPDPHGGTAKLTPTNLSEWYLKKWPLVSRGPYEKESYDLVTAFMRKHPENWSKVLATYESRGR